jgi:hypothetical protein
LHMKVRVRTLFVFSIVCFAVGVAMFLVLFFKGEQLLPHRMVFVPKDGHRVDSYTEITGSNFKELFEPKELLAAAVGPNVVTLETLDVVMGKTMVMPLFPYDLLTTRHVQDGSLVPKPDEKEYPIPANWLEVMDWTGRMGDQAEIWLFPTEKLKQFYTQKSKPALSPESNTQDQPRIVPDLPERPLNKPLFVEVRLRYVTDETNRSVKNSLDSDDRSNSTGRPYEVKAFLTSQQYAQLKNAVEEGYKLIIAVKEL